jgi:hypothetical protein
MVLCHLFLSVESSSHQDSLRNSQQTFLRTSPLQDRGNQSSRVSYDHEERRDESYWKVATIWGVARRLDLFTS